MGKVAKCCQLSFAVIFLGSGGYLIWHFLGRPESGTQLRDSLNNIDFGDFTNVWDNLTNDAFDDLLKSDADPSVGDNTTYEWENDKNGLSLEVYNALDDTWQGEYEIAMGDWENGTPDSLTLTSTKVTVDRACTPVDGVMKVCSGNYGETGWLGINELIILNRRTIKNSVAKMNEFYLLNADADKRRYVMCHEIGHGFGLPHTDEQFDNRDLGDCLDYTNTPRNNLLPGEVNYNKLQVLYGTVGGGGRKLRAKEVEPTDILGFSPELLAEYNKAKRELENISRTHSRRRRHLNEHVGDGHEIYSRKLDDEHTLQVQVHYV
ncbi:unnamed protein product [Cylindrotheca closterium]|uniref:Peptidase M10 metallopeptidase domain-containing protein n=1 Tax=Cylindrotheca closterium TaxID=2856 RepID=A0AAD2G8H4_9STRA|nr:unnamed protein product [Cylindrotheca closterium]